MPEREDRRFECSIQRRALSPCSLHALKGPGTAAKCWSLVAHTGTGSLCPRWRVERQLLSLKALMRYCQTSEPQVRGALECLQFHLYNSISLTNQELHSIAFPLLSFEHFCCKLWVQKFNYRPWCTLITPKEERELRAQLHSAVTLYLA